MIRPARNLLRTILAVTHSFASLVSLGMRSRAQLAAENLFLRKQLALYMARRVKRARRRQADLAIAACAIEGSASLWTLNRSDFDDVPELTLFGR